MLKKSPVYIFLSLHSAFLMAAILENRKQIFPSIVLIIISILLGFFYFKKIEPERSVFRRIDNLLVLFTALGAAITYFLNTEFRLGTVLAAGITGLCSSIIPYLNRKSDLLRELPVAMYCGAFVGMTAPVIANGYTFILLAGLLSGMILILTKATLHGFGGKLGTIAFGGVSMVSLILFLFY